MVLSLSDMQIGFSKLLYSLSSIVSPICELPKGGELLDDRYIDVSSPILLGL